MCNCRLKHFENLATDGRNDTAGIYHSLSQRKKLANVIASDKTRPRHSSTLAVTSDESNRMAFTRNPAKQHISEGLDNNKPSNDDKSHPVIAAVEGAFHTQYLLFSRNDASASDKSAFLLKIESNCCWDSIKHRILQTISKQCPDNTVYPTIEKLHIDGFLVEILPKSDHPVTLPSYVQQKMTCQSLQAISIRITIDHPAVNSPLCTSQPTGLSAFAKLKFKFLSEKSCSESSMQPGTGLVSQMSTSFNSRCSKTVTATKSVMQPTSIPVIFSNQEKSRLQAVKSTNSVSQKPAILCSPSLSSADNSTDCKMKLSSTTTDDGDSKPSPRNLTATSPVAKLSAGTASNMQSVISHTSASKKVTDLPLNSFSSAYSSFLCTQSSTTQKNLKKLRLPIKGAESVKLPGPVMQSSVKCDNISSRKLNAFSGSLYSIRQGVCEAVTSPSADVIVVEDDDSVPADISIRHSPMTYSDSSVHSSSVQLSTTLFQSSHSSSSVVDMTSQDKPVSLLPQTVTYRDSVACTSRNSLCTVSGMPVSPLPLSVSVSSPALSDQSILKEATVLQAVSSRPTNKCTSADLEQVTEGQQMEIVECSSSVAEPSLTGIRLTEDSATGLLVDTETAAVEDVSSDAKKYSVVDASQPRCESVASTAGEVVGATTDSASHLSLLPAGVDELKSIPSAEQSSTISEHQHQQLCNTQVPDALAMPDNTVEIVPSDEVCTFCAKTTRSCDFFVVFFHRR